MISARAMAMRWRWPPENSWMYLSRIGRRRGRHRSSASSIRGARSRRRRRRRPSRWNGSAISVSTRWRGSKLAVGVLEHHLQLAAGRDAPAAARRASLPSRAMAPPCGRLERQDGAGERRLAAAAFADQPDDSRRARCVKLTPSTARKAPAGSNRCGAAGGTRGRRRSTSRTGAVPPPAERRIALRRRASRRQTASRE